MGFLISIDQSAWEYDYTINTIISESWVYHSGTAQTHFHVELLLTVLNIEFISRVRSHRLSTVSYAKSFSMFFSCVLAFLGCNHSLIKHHHSALHISRRTWPPLADIYMYRCWYDSAPTTASRN